ncbi:MAG: NYN domain-containing protein [Anaerolineales bacterium]|nr:NYN domain-containing protein [Anaerolineales bacterium]
MERVITYIDGYNLYYGLRSKGWKRFYWLNVQALAKQFLKPNQTLVMTRYFTTVVKQPEDKRRRQAVFLDALKTLPNFQIYYGHFLSETIVCRRCGHTYTTYHEKMTDVNISVEVMADASKNNFDTALLISADSDLAGVVAKVKNLFHPKRVIAVFPPGRTSFALKQASSGVLHIGHVELSKSMFPEQVIESDGVVLRRPIQWK